MKKFFLFLGVVCAVFCASDAFSAAKVLVPKKADSVVKRDSITTTSDAGAGALSTVASVALNAMALSQQQKALTAECEPNAKEVAFVNSLVKEWANAGAQNPMKTSGVAKCSDLDSTQMSYKISVARSVAGSTLDTTTVCWDTFTDAEARGAVWAGFPKADVAEYCSDGNDINMCGKNSKKKVTNLWDIFNMIPFEEKDYTASEASQAQALLQKSQNCTGSKLAAKRLESFRGFVSNTIGSIGQPTNTGSIMDVVSGVVGQTNIGGTLGGVAPVLGQFLDR